MTFVSYAQNFEDVLLWRALRQVSRGFYIDVGAAHPDIDSVTRAFYDRDWTGINIEPVLGYAERLAAARPRDVTLQVALAEVSGSAPFFAVSGSGLSTLNSEVARGYRANGFPIEECTITVETLAAVCARHAPDEIHFLKIDVEGAERDVLAGADFSRFRPWIVLIEATRPMSTEPVHADWEPLLLDAGYRFAWFDGLNRFYIAAEKHAVLAPHFTTPVNVFDDFLRAADTEWARRIHAAETEAAALRQRTEAAEAWATQAEDRAVAAASRLLAGFAEASRGRRSQDAFASAAMAQLRAEIDHHRSRADHAESWLAALRNSTSWRLTGPLRRATRLLRRAANSEVLSTSAAVMPAAAVPAAASPLLTGPPAPPAHQPNQRRPLLAVHQFHSGSAVGDAITNGMLFTRGLLRRLGYASEIYVEHRDPLLAAELRLLEEMPRHADYVLLLHHSMGYDAFAQVVALQAPKVLAYHNITPPEFLAGSPVSQRYAKLGRDQLAALRPHVAAALAMSEYNAIELRDLGFAPVRACSLLFDINSLGAGPLTCTRPAALAKAFTILFVGRVTASKGQQELLEAFIRFRAGYAGTAQLVLVGRPDDSSGYIEALQARVDETGLDGQVIVTGLVSDEELRSWYAAADLYVSLSQHEGFGVPLVEAVAQGVPVLAWPSGAVPYTLGLPKTGEPDGLLLAREPEEVAARILAMAEDPFARAALARAQWRAAERFRLDRQLPALREALALAGAAEPPDQATRAALIANLRFTVTGHANGSYSLAAVNRTLAQVLEEAFPGRTKLVPIEGHAPAPLADPPAAIRHLVERPGFDTGPQVVVSNHYPVHVPEELGDLPLSLFYWEESLIPPATIDQLNSRFRGVLTATSAVAKALVDSGLTIPVRVIGQSLDLAPFFAMAEQRRLRDRTGPVTLLHVSSCFPRKGVDVLLAAYARAFRAGDPVRLVIKGFPNPHNDVAEQIAALRARDPAVAPIELIDRDLDQAAMLSLFAAADAMVLPTRGEGFNMAAAEAMAAGLPLIVTGAGGHRDFCDDTIARLLEWRHAPSRSHLAPPHSLWIEPDEADLVAALRDVAAAARGDGEAARALASQTMRARTAIEAATDGPALSARLAALSADLLLAPPPRPLRMAWITSWAVRCGVAEYARYLLTSLPEPVPELVVLADARTELAEADGGPRVRVAWQLGDAASMTTLARAIAVEDPDLVMIQHQPGLFDFEALAELLRSPALAGRACSVTLHTVEQLVDHEPAARDGVVAALAGASRVIVHTLADLDRLQQLGLVANAVLIPQGTRAPGASQPPRPLGPEASPLIGCYGFFLPGKGIPQLIEAVLLLRARWPGIRLRLVNAAYSESASGAEIASCRALAAASGLDDAIEWCTEFLPDAESMAKLAECDLVALPNQTSKEGSSASVRNALVAGAPVVVTPLPFFDEVGDAVARFGGTNADDLAAGLDSLLRNLDARRRLQAAAQDWLRQRQWSVIGPRTLQMLIGLAAERMCLGAQQ